MRLRTQNNYMQFVLVALFLNSLIVTPITNKDGMIIPKMSLMFILALFFIPLLAKNLKVFFEFRTDKFFLLLNFIILAGFKVVIDIKAKWQKR